uniref:Uncharacterized protein n=1 Tax=Rhizophora mucronata TaxID=61149 RepID=A0A2P2QGH1_RHIMU
MSEIVLTQSCIPREPWGLALLLNDYLISAQSVLYENWM